MLIILAFHVPIWEIGKDFKNQSQLKNPITDITTIYMIYCSVKITNSVLQGYN